MQEAVVALDDLLLDPNNYRFQDAPRYRQVPETRFHEPSVQTSALDRLDAQGIGELKASIQHNGFLTVDRVVVRPWRVDPAKWVIIEGNRRIAALMRLREDHRAGIEVNASVLHVLDGVPVLQMESENNADYMAIMGIRHVGGVRRWGPYQSSKLITELRDGYDLDFSEIALRLGLTTREVTRRYRAFKALSQMESDEEFGESAQRSLYPIFHEAVSQPVLREWLGWSDSSFEFSNDETRGWFYELLSPVETSDGEEVTEPKITTSAQVRKLKSILASEDARRVLRDPARSFAEAEGVAATEELIDNWPAEISEAVRALEKLPVLTLASLDQSRLALIQELRDKASEVLDSYKRLRS